MLRFVLDTEGQHDSRAEVIQSVAGKIGCTPKTLRKWLMQSQSSSPMLAQQEAKCIQALERENRELKRANEILRKASAFFVQAKPKLRSTADKSDGSFHPRPQTCVWGRGICKVLPIRSSRRRATCIKHDGATPSFVANEKNENHGCVKRFVESGKRASTVCMVIAKYGTSSITKASKWHVLSWSVSCKTSAYKGPIRGRAFKGTTPSDDAQAKPQDLMQRDFKAQRPHPLWVAGT